MAEQIREPGLFVTTMAPAGTCYRMDLSAFGFTDSRIGIAMNPADWQRLTGAQQEELRDLFIRDASEHGFEKLGEWLAIQGQDG